MCVSALLLGPPLWVEDRHVGHENFCLSPSILCPYHDLEIINPPNPNDHSFKGLVFILGGICFRWGCRYVRGYHDVWCDDDRSSHSYWGTGGGGGGVVVGGWREVWGFCPASVGGVEGDPLSPCCADGDSGVDWGKDEHGSCGS